MASTDARPVPLKNTAFRVTFCILDADGDLVTGATGLDSEVSIDGGTFADCASEATEIATSSGMYYLDLTAGEMNGDTIAVIVKTSSSGAKTTPLVFYPKEAGDVTVLLEPTTHTSAVIPTVTTVTGGATAAALATVQSDTDDIQTRLPAALVGGRMDASVGAMAAAVVTAAALAPDAIGASELAADAAAEIASAVRTELAVELARIDAATSSRSTVTSAQVKTQVTDSLNVDTYAEPTAVLPATASLAARLIWIACLTRNKVTQTSTTQTLKADDTTTTVAAAAVSDDGTTLTRGEWA